MAVPNTANQRTSEPWENATNIHVTLPLPPGEVSSPLRPSASTSAPCNISQLSYSPYTTYISIPPSLSPTINTPFATNTNMVKDLAPKAALPADFLWGFATAACVSVFRHLETTADQHQVSDRGRCHIRRPRSFDMGHLLQNPGQDR